MIQCITTLFEKIQLDNVVIYKTVLIILLKQIFNLNSGTIMPDLPEELKMSILECIEVSARRLMSSVLDEFYNEKNLQLIGQICHACVQIINNEGYRKLRMVAIRCILSMFQLHENAEFGDIVIREQISKTVFITIPKIYTTLIAVVREDDVKGTQLKLLALKSLRLILTLIFEEFRPVSETERITVEDFKKIIMKSLKNEKSDEDKSDAFGITLGKPIDNAEKQIFLENNKRNEGWFRAASKKIQVSLGVFVRLRVHPSREIREELAAMNCELLIKCSRYMEPCLPHFLETIITLTEDPDTEVSTMCRQTLEKVLKRHENYSFWVDIQFLFNSHLLTMPRIICRDDDNDLTAALMLLRAYIKFLTRNRLKTVLNDTDTLERLIMILITTVELDLSTGLLLEEHLLRDAEEIIKFDAENLPWKQFKRLKSDASKIQLREICQTLGGGPAGQLITTCLLDRLNSNRESANEILVLLNFSLANGMSRIALENILDELLADYHWTLTIYSNSDFDVKKNRLDGESEWFESRTEGLYEGSTEIRYTDIMAARFDDEDDHITISDSKLHVLHTCLAIETTGNLALFVKDDFHNYLFRTFHRFLEKAGNPNYMIHLSGMYALNKLREAYGAKRIADMIYDSTDYLIYHLKILFRKNEYNRVGLNILCVVLKYSSIILLPHLDTIVNDVLAQDLNQRQDLFAFLQLFEMSIYAMHEWVKKDTKYNVKPVEKTVVGNPQSAETLRHLVNSWFDLLEDTEALKALDEIDIDNANDEDCQVNPGVSDEIDFPLKPELPKEITLTLTILNASLKFLASKRQAEKLIVLRIINEGIEILRHHENELLPFIDGVWRLLAERFLEKDLVIMSESLMLLVTLGRLSKDFIRRRALR